MWTVNPDTFKSDDVAKSCPVVWFLYNPDTIGCVWTGRFGLNTCGRGLKALKQQFSKMANACKIDMPECSSSSSTARKVLPQYKIKYI